MTQLEERGIPVRSRLLLSEACPLILPYHIAVDNAREKARGESDWYYGSWYWSCL